MPLTTEEIEELARNPQAVTGDSGSFTERDADDLIKLDQYAAQKEAAANGKPPIRLFKIIPPGTV